MKKILFLILSILFLAQLSVSAQEDLSASLLRGVWQSNRSNPALLPEGRLVIGIGGFYNNLLIENVTYNDLVYRNEAGLNVLDIDKGIAQLETQNLLKESFDIESISVAARLGKVTLLAGHTVRFGAFLDYPKTLPQLIWQGNAQFIGQSVAFGPKIDLTGYHEFAVGAAFQVTDRLTIGGKAKYLSGIGQISTERNQLILHTDDDVYQLTLDADLLVNSAGSLTYNGFEDLAIDFQFGTFDTEHLFSGNSGYAFDLGAHLDLGKWDVAISALDVGGKINWKDEVRNYSLQGLYEYEGLDIAESILDDSTSFGSTIDTLKAIYEPTETTLAYSTQLPARYYLSATYEFSERWRFGALLYTESFLGASFPAAALSANARINRFVNLGATYAFRNDRADNLGLNAVFRLGPVQLVAATDNVITAFRPQDSNSANLRVGLNLTFGQAAAQSPDEVDDPDSFF